MYGWNISTITPRFATGTGKKIPTDAVFAAGLKADQIMEVVLACAIFTCVVGLISFMCAPLKPDLILELHRHLQLIAGKTLTLLKGRIFSMSWCGSHNVQFEFAALTDQPDWHSIVLRWIDCAAGPFLLAPSRISI